MLQLLPAGMIHPTIRISQQVNATNNNWLVGVTSSIRTGGWGSVISEYWIVMDVAVRALWQVVVAYCFGFASNLDPPWLVLAYQGTP